MGINEKRRMRHSVDENKVEYENGKGKEGVPGKRWKPSIGIDGEGLKTLFSKFEE